MKGYYKNLKLNFNLMREKQARLFNRELTKIDEAVGNCIFETAKLAMKDVAERNTEISMRAVSIGTGLGKSTSAWAFIASTYQLSKIQGEDFSCAYIVPTIKMGMEVQEGIEALTGKGTTRLWSWCHKHKGRDLDKVKRELGFIPSRVINKDILPESPVVILTHKFWCDEIKKGIDNGCRRYKGKLRDIIFVDESPELVDIVATHSTVIQELFERVAKHNDEHSWLSVLSEVVKRMNDIILSPLQRYVPTALISKEEVKVLDNATHKYLMDFTDETLSKSKRDAEAVQLFDCVKFLRASANGCSFYSHRDKTFFAYQFDFDPEPGHVLLDATSDISGLVALNPKIKQVKVPEVRYENLEICHFNHPKKFKNVSQVVKRADTGEAYGSWIKQMVMENTASGDDILIITHKAVLDLRFIDSSNDPESPLEWEGRKVNTQHWGNGIGENKFRDKTHVFLFGEFFIPRPKTISDVHAWGEIPLTENHLKQATGRRKSGDDYTPRGIYLQPYEGHLLRWSKQLSMRGTARNIDGDGQAKHMKLFTSMDRNRLISHYDRLFPGAKIPQSISSKVGHQEDPQSQTGRESLISILMNKEKSVIGADEVQRITGIKTCKLNREFSSESVKGIALKYGWRIASAGQLGKSGRMKYLVNDKLLTEERLQAA